MATDDICDLRSKKCGPCNKKTPPLDNARVTKLLRVLPKWSLQLEDCRNSDQIRRRLVFPNFVTAMAFINQVAELAEIEGHHPDIKLKAYSWVWFTLHTYAIDGLSENDFILAAKIDTLAEAVGL